MNLWIVTSEFPPVFGGGIATYCMQFATALQSEGHQVTILTRPGGDSATDSRVDNALPFEVLRIHPDSGGPVRALTNFWHSFAFQIAESVIQRIKEVGAPDAIEVQEYGGLAYYLIKRKLAGDPWLQSVPIVVFCHTPVFELERINDASQYRFPEYWLGRMEKFCLMGADQVISPSHFLADHLQPYTRQAIQVCPLPFSVKQHPTPNKAAIRSDLLFVGRAEYRKGILQFLNALSELWEDGHTITFRMIGGDTTWSARGVSMKQLIRDKYAQFIRRGLLRIDEALPPEHLAAELTSTRAVVVPSLYENFPYVCVEAMAAGNLMLVSRSGGQAEMVGDDGTKGFLFDINDREDVKEAILCAMQLSTEKLQEASRASRSRIEDLCDPAKYVSRRVGLFETARESDTTARKLYPFVNDLEVEGARDYSKPIIPSPDTEAGQLTVIIPYYNMGDFIDETLESVMRSDYSHIRVLIVNDGSTDPKSIDTLARIRSVPYRFPVQIVDVENGGLANARNIGAKASQTDIIAFLDADDKVNETYYSKCVNVLHKYRNVSFVYSWVEYFGANPGHWITFDTDLPYILAANMLAAFLVVRKEDFLSSGQNWHEMKYGLEDFEAWVRMVSAGKQGVAVPEFLSYYRIRPHSMARQMASHTVLRMYEQIVDNNPAAFHRWGAELAKLTYANGPGRLWHNPAMDYGALGYAGTSSNFDGLARLANNFSEQERRQIITLLTAPRTARLIATLMKTRIHRPVIAAVSWLLRARR